MKKRYIIKFFTLYATIVSITRGTIAVQPIQAINDRSTVHQLILSRRGDQGTCIYYKYNRRGHRLLTNGNIDDYLKVMKCFGLTREVLERMMNQASAEEEDDTE